MSEIKAYKGTFIKTKTGEERTMRFCYARDIEERLPRRKTERVTKRTEGVELVWDLDAGGYRSFNFNNQVGNLEEATVDEAELPAKAQK